MNYSYYEGSWSVLPNYSQIPKVKEGTIYNFNLVPRNRDDNFSLTFEGYIELDRTGTYTFYVDSDEGSKLYINGKQVVDNDGLHTVRERSGSISLSAGKHAIRVEYFERMGSQYLKVRYAGPSLSKRAIPHEKLFRRSDANARTKSSTNKAAVASEKISENLVEQIAATELRLFPNPVQTDLNIQLSDQFSGGMVYLQVIDMTGQVVAKHQYHKVNNRNLLKYSMNNLPKGSYVIILYDRINKLIEEKIIKK